jgi:hypothetical protein
MSIPAAFKSSLRRVRLVLAMTWIGCVVVFVGLLVLMQIARHYEWDELVSTLVLSLGVWSVIGPALIAFPAAFMLVRMERGTPKS